MKFSIALLFALLSCSVNATECLDAPNSLDPIRHLEKSSDVLFGTVIGGKLKSNVRRGEIAVDFSIAKPIKGNKSGVIQLRSPMYTHFAIGYSYIVYLYGSNEIKPCAMVIELMPAIESMEALYHQSQRTDVNFGKDLRKLLNHVGYKP
ncbi:hypothetical protein [Oceanicoccus sp. KOV_DT_Chl]|uniref:hypothetical protein n=1 Tax=Oceanicoccus sp. KOV_DT_Chl TaxID=1904639 RepID=UPI000C797906|nr:hypothetical protein [Oceanicoccus sp. KOV_DT_Chl]